MNATGINKIVVVLLGLGLPVGIASHASAQPSASTTAASQLSRKDVDRLLGEARAAIEKGELVEADALISRSEEASIRYPLFHFGDTPSSLRRELMRAQSSTSGEGGVTGMLKRTLGKNEQQGTEDPFLTPGPGLPKPAKMLDPEVTPASATGPYGNFRAEVPGALPKPDSAAPAAYPVSSSPPSRYPTAASDSPSQPNASGIGVVDSNNRYANPAGLMEVSLDDLPSSPSSASTPQANQVPEVSELRFAQLPGTPAPEALPAGGSQALVAAGEQALKNRERERALELFREANADRNSLDLATRERLDSHLRMLTTAPNHWT